MVDSRKRIAGAFIIGFFIVSGAFVMAKNKVTKSSAVAVIPVIERQHIDISDRDKDGVPDWQDALLTEDPIIIATSTATYTPPTTVTGKFAVSFFKDFIHSKIYGVLGDSKEDLVKKTITQLKKEAVDELFTQDDIQVIANTDTPSLRVYGNQVAQIILDQEVATENELMILQDALDYNQPETLEKLSPIATAYGDVLLDLLALEVPPSYTQKHLDLLNALNAVLTDVRAMQNVDHDAMYALLRVKRYQDDALGLSNALTNLFNALYFTDSVRWGAEEPTSRLIIFTQ